MIRETGGNIYEVFRAERFFVATATEEQVRELFWRSKYGGWAFICPHCGASEYYQHASRPEVRTCRQCRRQARLRAGTILENSKLPLLVWAKAIYYMMEGKRGMSALELKRRLGASSYGTVWALMHKIRRALYKRDEGYRLCDRIELNRAVFRRREKTPAQPVLLEVETRRWADEQGRLLEKVGFAKVVDRKDPRPAIQKYWYPSLPPGVFLDIQAPGREPDRQRATLERWQPWIHRLVANVQTWLSGTHHGVGERYFLLYLSEYLYRYNRRHDPNRLFHRALIACLTTSPPSAHARSG